MAYAEPKKIDGLTEATSIGDTDLIPIYQSSETKKLAASYLGLHDAVTAGTGISVTDQVVTNDDTGSGAVSTHEGTYDHSDLHTIATAGTGISITGQEISNDDTGSGAVSNHESSYDHDDIHEEADIAGSLDVITGHIETVADKTYWLGEMPYAGKVTATVTHCDSGTATATFSIGSTALGGTANSVSSSRQSQAHTTSNTFSAGGILKMVISSNSTCLEMRFSVYIERT